MSTRRVRIDFFQVQVNDGVSPFVESLDEIGDRPDDTSRNQTVDEGVLRLHAFEKTKTQRQGELIRIRMNDGPMRASTQGGPPQEFQLQDHEGFGEQTAFLYDVPTRVLVIQSHRVGVTPGRFIAYVEHFTEYGINILAIETEDKMTRLRSMHDVRRFEVAVAGTGNAAALASSDPAVSELNSVLKALKAPSIHITLTRGHDTTNFLSKGLVNLARKLSGEENVQTLRITGATDEKANDALDLLVDRLREEDTADVSDSTRHVPYLTRKGMLQKAWHKHAADLRKRFK